MRLHLHKLTIRLESHASAINAHWQRLFDGWLDDESDADLTLKLDLVPQLPPLPDKPPLFSDKLLWPDGRGVLTVYAADHGRVLLHFQDGAMISVPLENGRGSTHVSGVILPDVVASDRFEDVVYTSLAPLLRRHAYFLVHAFAAGRDDTAVLIVGPTHSGKTTAGLSLLLGGYRLLSNDIALLEQRPDGIYCLPTPGDVGIRPASFDLLPQLSDFVGRASGSEGVFNAAAQRVIGGNWAEAARITAVCLAHVEADQPTRIQPTERALCLAKLMEESMDRWDAGTLLDHIAILQATCGQSHTFDLQLGQGVSEVPALLNEAMDTATAV